MSDNVAITAGSGTSIAADEVSDGTLGTVKVQYVKLMDGTLDGTTKAAVNSNGLKVDGSAVTQPVSNTGTFATQAAQSGTWTVQPGNTPNTTAWKVDNSAAWDKGSGTGGTTTMRVYVDNSQLSALGQTTMSSSAPVTLASDQKYQTGMSSRAISAAVTTLTRPANVTAYTAGDSISNNATAGSVTALSATVSDTNDDPIVLTEMLINSSDTGLAGKKIRAIFYSSDPTASTGVGGGDNAAFSNKKAGYFCSMSGTLETGFSDGTVGRLVPTFNDGSSPPTPAGSFAVTKPVSGAKTIFVQYQAVDAFTPSANSTTIDAFIKGFQGRAS